LLGDDVFELLALTSWRAAPDDALAAAIDRGTTMTYDEAVG
jgi:hypothetical protein